MRRHVPARPVGGQFGKRLVATQAAAEGASGIDLEVQLCHHLPKLLRDSVGADQKVPACLASLDEAGIAGEDQAILHQRPLDKLGVVELRVIVDIESQNPEPASQRPEHGISQKGRLCSYEIVTGRGHLSLLRHGFEDVSS